MRFKVLNKYRVKYIVNKIYVTGLKVKFKIFCICMIEIYVCE